MIKVLLDTDVLSNLMRQHPMALKRAHVYLTQHRQLSFSVITRYEILRGLEAKNAHRKIKNFDLFCQANQILPLTDNVIQQAAKIYGDLHRDGQLIGDADILIAATAQIHKLPLVTNNQAHFGRITNLAIENWLTP